MRASRAGFPRLFENERSGHRHTALTREGKRATREGFWNRQHASRVRSPKKENPPDRKARRINNENYDPKLRHYPACSPNKRQQYHATQHSQTGRGRLWNDGNRYCVCYQCVISESAISNDPATIQEDVVGPRGKSYG